jgi:hypothetical protein
VWRDAREQSPADADGHDSLICPRPAKRDDWLATPLLDLGVGAGVVIALVGCDRLGRIAASVEGVDQRRDKVGLLPSRRLDLPGERQPGPGADSGSELVAVEPASDSPAISENLKGESMRETANGRRPLPVFARKAGASEDTERCLLAFRCLFEPVGELQQVCGLRRRGTASLRLP